MSTAHLVPLTADVELELRFLARPTASPHEALALRFENLPGNFAGKYLEQFLSDKDVEGPCWVWTACVNSKGYGQVWNSKRKKVELSHRLAYESVVGPIPEGFEVDHLCEVIRCCNPLHLDAVPPVVNNHRRHAVSGSQCRKGHPRDQKNLKVKLRPDGTVKTVECRLCANEAQRERRRAAQSSREPAVEQPLIIAHASAVEVSV